MKAFEVLYHTCQSIPMSYHFFVMINHTIISNIDLPLAMRPLQKLIHSVYNKETQYKGERRRKCRTSLPGLELQSELPADAARFRSCGKSRTRKPQKSTCMVVRVQRGAVRQPALLCWLGSS